MTRTAAIVARHATWSRRIERAIRLWASMGSARVPRRTALGTVRPAASAIAPPANASDVHPTHAGASPSVIWTTTATIVASITAAISRFIGRAAVVTRA